MSHQQENQTIIEQQREIMKCHFGQHRYEGDEKLKKQQLPLSHAPKYDTRIVLPTDYHSVIKKGDLFDVIMQRRSNRFFLDTDLSIQELSLLLWCSQGVKEVKGNQYATLRTVPSAGARHPFETYLLIHHVSGLAPGIYHYLALQHELEFMKSIEEIMPVMEQALYGSPWSKNAAVIFLWSVVPYRTEWRYNIDAHKEMLIDAGHLCQNLYLTCESIECGTCGVESYQQEFCDDLLGLDGKEEFVVYTAPVGKKKPKPTI